MFDRRIFLASVGVGAVALLTGCSGASDETADLPLRVAVVGDSNTTGLQGTLENGVANDVAWIAQVRGSSIEYAGGWAADGSSSTLMAQKVVPLEDVDVVVVMAGTNNAAQGVSFEQLQADLETIVSTVGARYAVVAAIPPINATPTVPPELNAQLEAFAEQKGWHFHDAWGSLRGDDEKWLPQYLLDGLHTTPAGYLAMGEDMRSYLLEEFTAQD